MKKYVKGLCAVLMAVLMVASLAACGGESNAGSVVGTWTLNQVVTKDGKAHSLEEYVKMSASGASDEAVKTAVDKMKMNFEFTNDGKVSLKTVLQNIEGTYTVSGSTITMKATVKGASSTDTMELKNDVIVMKDPNTGLTFHFKK